MYSLCTDITVVFFGKSCLTCRIRVEVARRGVCTRSCRATGKKYANALPTLNACKVKQKSV